MILSDEEIRDCWSDVEPMTGHSLKVHAFARAIESAILAKLASAELPEPVVIDKHESGYEIRGYKKDQLRQAYAYGAAAQLSEKPRLYAYTVNKVHNEYCEFEPPDDAYDEGTLVELYTRKEPK